MRVRCVCDAQAKRLGDQLSEARSTLSLRLNDLSAVTAERDVLRQRTAELERDFAAVSERASTASQGRSSLEVKVAALETRLAAVSQEASALRQLKESVDAAEMKAAVADSRDSVLEREEDKQVGLRRVYSSADKDRARSPAAASMSPAAEDDARSESQFDYDVMLVTTDGEQLRFSFPLFSSPLLSSTVVLSPPPSPPLSCRAATLLLCRAAICLPSRLPHTPPPRALWSPMLCRRCWPQTVTTLSATCSSRRRASPSRAASGLRSGARRATWRTPCPPLRGLRDGLPRGCGRAPPRCRRLRGSSRTSDGTSACSGACCTTRSTA
jgi:hypothetical protein